MFDNSIIKKSGQFSKLCACLAGVTIGGLSFLVGILYLIDQEYGIYFILFGFILLIIGSIGACLFIRCPSCKARLFWISVSTKEHDSWLLFLLANQDCPMCHYLDPQKSK